jgi:uncharacterized iron-regulated protein
MGGLERKPMPSIPRTLGCALGATVPIALLVTACAGSLAAQPQPRCPAPGEWAIPRAGTATPEPADRVYAHLARQQVVLLGEKHDDAEEHRWELHVVAGLYALRPHMVLGLEMFPRRVQPILDQWVAGQLSDEQFLVRSDWFTVWGFDPQPYMPIFQFARMHRIPLLALNVDRSLVSKVGEEGWAAIAAAEREGVTDPAPARPEYLQALYTAFQEHQPGAGGPSGEGAPPTAADLANPKFQHFVEGMLLWDRAMAQGIAEPLHGPDPPLVVALMGSGHVRDGYGVQYQLDALGVKSVAAALPWDPSAGCSDLHPGLADVLFALAERPTADRQDRPRLGITIEGGTGGVLIREVVAGSIAEQAGLRKGDLILMVAGEPAHDTGDVIAAVRRQAPGTWLPLQVKRDQTTLEIVARFPPRQP